LAASRSVPEAAEAPGAVREVVLVAVAEPEVVVRAEVLVAELEAAAAAEQVEPEEPVVALGEPEAGVEQAEPVERVAREGKGAGGNAGGTTGGTRGTGGANNYNNPYANPLNNPYNQSRTIVPQFPLRRRPNQQILAAFGRWHRRIFHFQHQRFTWRPRRKLGASKASFISWDMCRRKLRKAVATTLKCKTESRRIECALAQRILQRAYGESAGRQTAGKANGTAGGGSEPGLNPRRAASAIFFIPRRMSARVNLAMEIPPESLKFNKDKASITPT